MLDIVAISNLKAGRNSRGFLAEIEGVLPYRSHIVAPSRESYPAVMQEVVERDPDIMMIIGGDTTGSDVFTAGLNQYSLDQIPPVVLVNGGTVGMHGVAVGHSRNHPLQTIEETLALDHVDVVERNLVKVDYGGQTRFGLSFSNGIVTNFFERYDQTPGELAAKALVARGIAGFLGREVFKTAYREIFEEFPMTLEFPDETITRDMHWVFVYAMPVGLVDAFKFPHEKDLHVLAGSFDRKLMIKMIKEGILGQNLSAPINRSASQLIINGGSFILDGETVKYGGPVTLSPQKVRYVKL